MAEVDRNEKITVDKDFYANRTAIRRQPET